LFEFCLKKQKKVTTEAAKTKKDATHEMYQKVNKDVKKKG
jgi:hypothetical protein